jgi:hypothetical protein
MILYPTIISVFVGVILGSIVASVDCRGMGGMINEQDTMMIMTVFLSFVFFFLSWTPSLAVAIAVMSKKVSVKQKGWASLLLVLSSPMFVISLILCLKRLFR